MCENLAIFVVMKRIAVIFEGSVSNRLGVFNAVVNRVKHLQAIAPGVTVDTWMIQVQDGALMRRLRHSKAVGERPDHITADGVTVRVLWFKRSWMDVLRHRVLHRPPACFVRWLHSMAERMREYDLLSTHDRIAAQVGEWAQRLWGVPHFITWHGASIYTDPPRDPMLRAVTVRLLHSATCNFFVSEGLHRKALELTSDFPYEVLYNGASQEFHRFSDERVAQLREHYGLAPDEKVVTFVGRFEPVKNVSLLPRIFSLIASKFEGKVKFWTIGGGYQHQQVQDAMLREGVDCTMWGYQSPESIPDFLNCTSVLVLPSSLEGLPLVVIEALQCGANVVASDVVGTAEAIGKENAFDINDPQFVSLVAARAVQMLCGEVRQQLPPHISWEATARKELVIYQETLKNN